MGTYARTAADILRNVRASRPVVHNITNYVVMNSTANVLLAMGASPIMAHAPEEVEEVVGIASSLVVNIGTLSKSWIESMILGSRICKVAEKPFVLDPVGAGATKLRTRTATQIIDAATPTVIRGNASEIMALSAEGGTTRGVDAVHHVDDASEAARNIARTLGTIVAVTGERDVVTDGSRALLITGGHPLMAYVTGTGCAASAVVGAFLSQRGDPLEATATALAFFGLAGEWAARQADAPGSFWVKMLDALYAISPQDLESEARIDEA